MLSGLTTTKVPNIAEDIKIEFKILIELKVVNEIDLDFTRKVFIIVLEPCAIK